MKAAVLYGLLCTISIGIKQCYGEFTDIKDSSNSGKCENEKERLRVADQEIKIANLVNTIMAQNVKIANLDSTIMAQNAKITNPESDIMAQNVKIANLESTIMAQNVKIANLESTIMAQNTEFEKLAKQVLERRINQITSDYRFHKRFQQEIEHRKHLNESQNALVEKVKTLEINYSTNISELKGTQTVIQEQLAMSFEHRQHLNESQNALVEYIKASETIHNISFDDLKSTQSVFREQMEMCFEKQSLLESNLQKVVNETAEIAVKLELNEEDISRITKTRLLKRRDCQDVQSEAISTSGVYNIIVQGKCCISVYCDMDTDGGGWTVFQHRFDGSVDFYRSWADYKTGFGNLQTEFWLGNDYIHRITEQEKYKLRIQLEDFSGNKRYAEYNSFNVADEKNKYRLSIGSYSGTAGDSLSYHNNMAFSTRDRDNDGNSGHCSVLFEGAWWFADGCHYCQLNGLYTDRKMTDWKYNVWYHWPSGMTSMKTTTMMMRKI